MAPRRRPLTAVYLALVLAVGALRLGSAPVEIEYQLFLLLVPAAALVCWRSPGDAGPAGRLALALLGLALLAAAAALPTAAARGFVGLAIGWMALWTARGVAVERRGARWLAGGLVALGVAQAALGLLQALGGVERLAGAVPAGGRLASGTYLNRNHFAGLLNLCLALTLGRLFVGWTARRAPATPHSERVAQGWLVGTLGALLGLAVVLSQSRGGVAVSLATLLFVAGVLYLDRRRGGRRTLPVRAPAAVLLATLGLALAFGVDALLARYGAADGAARLEVYRDCGRLIADFPWYGVGPGAFGVRFRAYQSADLGHRYAHAHNDYLESAAEWGIPAATLFWGFVGWRWVAALLCFRRARDAERRGLALACAAAIFGVLLHSLVDFNLQIPANRAIFGAILGLGWAVGLIADDRWESRAESPRTAPRRLERLLAGVLLPLALAVAAARVGQRAAALRVALEDPTPRGLARALAWDGENPDLHLTLAAQTALLPRGAERARALGAAARAVALAPHSWRARWQLAEVQELAGQRAAAEQSLRAALARNPREGILRWRLANFLIRQGELGRALDPLRGAVGADPALRRPALALLRGAGAALEQLDAAWPDEPAARWFLLDELAQRPGRYGGESLEPFLSRLWRRLLGGPGPVALGPGGGYVAHLVAAGRGTEARQAWAALTARAGLGDLAFARGENRVWNGDFGRPLGRGPLAWTVTPGAGWTVAREGAAHGRGAGALRIAFDGSANASFAGVGQTLLLEPGGRFLLSCRFRATAISTDRGLYLEIYDRRTQRALLRTRETRGTTAWEEIQEHFALPPGVGIVELRLRRDRSKRLDNRLAGTLWLDDVRVAPE